MAFDGSARRSDQLLNLILERGADWEYFPKTAKSLFISDFSNQEEAVKREFEVEGVHLNFVGGSWCLGSYMGPRE